MDARRDRLIELLLVHSYQYRADPPFALSSGRTSPHYLDCKAVTLHPEGLHLVGGLGYEIVQRLGARAVGGLTLGADPISCAIAMHSFLRSTPLRAFVVRKEPKPHGMARWIEGGIAEGTRVAVVDDVITTGGSTVLAIDRAREAGLIVEDVLVLVDREEGARANLESHGVRVHAVVSMSELKSRREAAQMRAVQA